MAVGGWGSRVPTLSEKSLIVFKKTKCSKQSKKQNKPNFYFSLSGVPNVCGGWVGSDVWDKVPKKNVFFGHLPLYIQIKWICRQLLLDCLSSITGINMYYYYLLLNHLF